MLPWAMGCGMGCIFAQVASCDIAANTVNRVPEKYYVPSIIMKGGQSPHFLVCMPSYACILSKDASLSASAAYGADGARLFSLEVGELEAAIT